MESKLLRCDVYISTPVRPRHNEIAKRAFLVQSAMISQKNTVENLPNLNITKQNDTWLDRLAIKHLSRSVQDTTGLRNNKSGYDSLVEGAAMASRKFDPFEQRELVVKSLQKAIPRPILVMSEMAMVVATIELANRSDSIRASTTINLIRTMLPNSKFKREIFAIFTTIFFKWLVGPCEVRESEFNDQSERNVVHINKCRFLEESNCVGMCINLCKMPTQTFIKDSMGMPINMVPNFEDMSCEMIFGQNPPPTLEDPVFKQSCYRQSKYGHAYLKLVSNEAGF